MRPEIHIHVVLAHRFFIAELPKTFISPRFTSENFDFLYRPECIPVFGMHSVSVSDTLRVMGMQKLV